MAARLLAGCGGELEGAETFGGGPLLGGGGVAGIQCSLDLAEGRHAWVQIIKGSLDINGEILNSGDGAAISDVTALKLLALDDGTEFLLFDLK